MSDAFPVLLDQFGPTGDNAATQAQLRQYLPLTGGTMRGPLDMGGQDLINLGDFWSQNWDGAIPADLSSVDSAATAGIFFDSSKDSMQLMGDFWLGGNFTMSTGGVFRTASSGERFEFVQTDTNILHMYTGDVDEQASGQLTFDDSGTTSTVELMTSAYQTGGGKTGRTKLDLESSNAADTDFGDFDLYTDQALAKKARIFGDANATRGLLNLYAEGGDPHIRFTVGGTDRAEIQDQGVHVMRAGAAATPSLYFNSVTDKGFYDVTGSIAWATGGTYRGEFGQGIVVGGATGGDKGGGTINVATDLYKNNTAYTDPDWVFEYAATGDVKKYASRVPEGVEPHLYTLGELERYVFKHHHLPGISPDPMGMFERGDVALEWIERLVLYTFDLEERVALLEAT